MIEKMLKHTKLNLLATLASLSMLLSHYAMPQSQLNSNLEYQIQIKQLQLKQHSLLSRLLNSIEIKLLISSGQFLSQYDPLNPIYKPYAIRDRFTISISLNLSNILDNSTLKIKQLELKQLQHNLKINEEITTEKIKLLNEKIQIQSQIVELNELNFNQNKISIEKLLQEKIKLLELKFQLLQLQSELKNKTN
ncbi:MAG: hypothetical protein ABDI07_08815 [Candidatus Kryptonium sp.]